MLLAGWKAPGVVLWLEKKPREITYKNQRHGSPCVRIEAARGNHETATIYSVHDTREYYVHDTVQLNVDPEISNFSFIHRSDSNQKRITSVRRTAVLKM